MVQVLQLGNIPFVYPRQSILVLSGHREPAVDSVHPLLIKVPCSAILLVIYYSVVLSVFIYIYDGCAAGIYLNRPKYKVKNIDA
jgi:hypothetical protein